ncbi:transcription antitermination factor NusB [Magnetospira thiophila]
MTEKLSPSRRVAGTVLADVLDRNLPLEEAFAAAVSGQGLSPRDRAFARLIIATTLRRLGQIDDLIEHCLEHPLPDKARAIGHQLRLGIAQLLFLDVAPHAAVSAAVDLVAREFEGRFKGLVNGVLRSIAREGRGWAEQQDAARCNLPEWLWDSWSAAYGEDTCRRMVEAQMADPPLDFSVKSDPEGWAERLQGVVLTTGTVRRPLGGGVTDLPGFEEGDWWVQDAAAALPARLLGDVAGKRVLDLCAAPGGKTLQLAAAGAHVTAVDRSKNRMRRLHDNLARLQLTAEVIVADATQWRPLEPFEAILLDAPCTATGTLRRHPDVAYHRGPTDREKLSALQDRLLRAAIGMLAPGGVLVYCTCSLLPEEGEQRIDTLLAEGHDLTLEPVRAEEIGGWDEALTARGELRTLPCHLPDDGGLDGFYAARLRKV